MKYLCGSIIAVVFIATAIFSFMLAKHFYQEKIPETIIVEGEVDSTYIQSLQDSILTLMNKPPEIKIKVVNKYETKTDTLKIYVQAVASKEYDYSKPFKITDNNNLFNFDVNVYGVDSLFSDNENNYYINKNINIAVKNFKYKVQHETESPKHKLFSLYFGIGQGIYTYEEKSLYSAKMEVIMQIKERHLISIRKSFVLDGYEVSYYYRILSF